MDVVSKGPLGVASRVWPSAPGVFTLTVVCKATYLLAPGKSQLHQEQDAPNEEDSYWDDDPRRSLSSASDLVPFKKQADVVLVGSAFAPGGRAARSIVTRLIVGEIDKSVEAFCARVFRQTGEIAEGPRVTQVPLLYERAAGGPGTWNPVGVCADAEPDAYGMVPIAQLQPPAAHVAYRGDFVEPVGFGPIAPSWPTRLEKMGPSATGWAPELWYERPLPPGLDPAFFNVAPRDQRLNELRSDERIVLENLHREHERLVTNLPGLFPTVVAERAGGACESVALRADTLSIDTTRGVCSLVWRGWIQLAHREEAGRVVISVEGWSDPTATLPTLPTAEMWPVMPFTGTAAPPASRAAPSIPAIPFVSPRFVARADAPPPRVEDDGAATITAPLSPFREALPFRADVAPANVAPAMAAVQPPPLIARPLAPLGYDVSAPPPIAPSPVMPASVAPPSSEAAGPEEPEADEPEEPEADEPEAEAKEPEAKEPPCEPSPGEFPVERCGALTAAIAMARPETARILEAEGLAPERWEAVKKHYQDGMRDERARGKSALMNAFDAGYVAGVEERRGPIQVEEYARLVVGAERGVVESVLGELGLPAGAPMRIERVWAAKMMADPALARRVRDAIETERDR